jgi:hypothetical protein
VVLVVVFVAGPRFLSHLTWTPDIGPRLCESGLVSMQL